MGAFVLNFTLSATPRKTELARQARELLRVGLWGVPASAQLRPMVGDRVIAYVGAPERLFVGDAIVETEIHPWQSPEAARFPAHLGFDRGLALATYIWPLSVSLMDVWPKTQAAEKNPKAHFRGGIVPLSDLDAEMIIARGRREQLR